MRKRCHPTKAVVRHALETDGVLRVKDAVYTMRCPFDGSVYRMTRAAATIDLLRFEDGLDIETVGEQGDLCDYILHSPPRPIERQEWRHGKKGRRLAAEAEATRRASGLRPEPNPPRTETIGRVIWSCAKCGGRPASEVVEAFSGSGWGMAFCQTCSPLLPGKKKGHPVPFRTHTSSLGL